MFLVKFTQDIVEISSSCNPWRTPFTTFSPLLFSMKNWVEKIGYRKKVKIQWHFYHFPFMLEILHRSSDNPETCSRIFQFSPEQTTSPLSRIQRITEISEGKVVERNHFPQEKQYYPSLLLVYVHTSSLRDCWSYLLLSRIRFLALISLSAIYLIFFATRTILFFILFRLAPPPSTIRCNRKNVPLWNLTQRVYTVQFEESQSRGSDVIYFTLFQRTC